MNRSHFFRHLGTLAAAAALATPIGRALARRVEESDPGEVVRWGDVEFTICDFDPSMLPFHDEPCRFNLREMTCEEFAARGGWQGVIDRAEAWR